jgi:hypothetical protein
MRGFTGIKDRAILFEKFKILRNSANLRFSVPMIDLENDYHQEYKKCLS